MDRIVIVGCQDVEGFDAVAVGGKVNFELVQPGIVKIAQKNIDKDSSIVAILLECTELPQFADALRFNTKIPVFDAITGIEWMASSRMDNALFGIDFEVDEGEEEDYWFGKYLSAKEREDVVNKDALKSMEEQSKIVKKRKRSTNMKSKRSKRRKKNLLVRQMKRS